MAVIPSLLHEDDEREEWNVLVEAAHCQGTKPHRNLEFVSRLSCLVQRQDTDLSVGLVNVGHESISDTSEQTTA
jgi:hypothetical protein